MMVYCRPMEPFTDAIPTLPRPFVNLYDDQGRKINVILVSHPFTRQTGTNGSYEQYVEGKEKGIHFLGISSYAEFPQLVSNPHDILSNKEEEAWKNHDYMGLFEGWLHCFRDPINYIKESIPKILISESDFVQENDTQPSQKKFDFIYVCLKDNDQCQPGWQSYNRNWELAKKCIHIMCQRYNLKGLLVGRINCDFSSECDGHMTVEDFMPKKKLIERYKQSRFIFLPNIVDASPRVLAEALCYDIPALVNKNILGGWKYIHDQTGEFFNNEHDFESSLKRLLRNIQSNHYHPRDYFTSHYGNHSTGVQLKNFILDHIKGVNFTKDSTQYISLHKGKN